MRIQSTADYKKYMSLLGTCTADCEGKHSGLIDSGCGFPPGATKAHVKRK
jgi:hypothetical protein